MGDDLNEPSNNFVNRILVDGISLPDANSLSHNIIRNGEHFQAQQGLRLFARRDVDDTNSGGVTFTTTDSSFLSGIGSLTINAYPRHTSAGTTMSRWTM